MRDLIVAGGGPVGLATALYAARAGLDVAVHERRTGTIDKACGEGLMPGAVAALHDLGVDPIGHPLSGIRYLRGDAEADAPFRAGNGRGVRRTRLHAALADAVDSAGIPRIREAVDRVHQDDTSVRVNDVSARYLVAADGLHSPVRRLLGLDRPVRSQRRFGLRAHVQVAPWTDRVEVHWSSVSEAYVTPVAADLVGVAVLTSSRTGYLEQLASFPRLHERIGGREISAVRGAGPLRQRSQRRVAGRTLLVGDASGYVDALTGEGIALGLAQARAAVEAIVAEDVQRYELDWRRVTRRYRALTSGLLYASRLQLTRRVIVPAASALPWAFAAIVDQLARPA